ncbi:M20/M25/M40 family metallo-hydrolase [Pseudokordiimonas caeni]|uniref:M20/M25/M40 family metallo-hydrolase n=1 Tax=Pseudokordiimonas caeni TaxID=2997908 RepID=UPI0028121627|nr:M20/M25/M40 family metallo-hydrolase [Pseudokordiimonas caeni]
MVRRLILSVVALLAVLAAVMVGRTLMAPGMPAPVAAPEAFAVNEEEAVAKLAKALTFETISRAPGAPYDTEAFDAFHAWLGEAFPNVFSQLKVTRIAGHSLLIEWPGKDTSLQPAMFLAHMDVVPVDPATLGEWTHPPFAGTVADGMIWGRGALDMKGPLITLLEATETLLARGYTPARTILLGLGHDEEVGGSGAVAIAAHLKETGIRPAFVLDEGGAVATDGLFGGTSEPVALIGVAEKGYMSVKLTARGQGGHSSRPGKDTAISRLAKAIQRLEGYEFPNDARFLRSTLEPAMPLLPFGQRLAVANLWLTEPLVVALMKEAPDMAASLHTTKVPTILSAGIKDNVIPTVAEATVNLRLFPGDAPEAVLATLREVIADDMISVEPASSVMTPASPVSPTDSDAYRLISDTIKGMTPDAPPPVATMLVLMATDVRHYAGVSDAQYRFNYVPMTPALIRTLHAEDERVPVSAIPDMVRFFGRMMLGAGG